MYTSGMDFGTTLLQLSTATQIEDFSRILQTQNDFQSIFDKLDQWINNHPISFTPEHVDCLLLINRNITKIKKCELTIKINQLSLMILLSHRRNPDKAIADLAAPLISMCMTRGDLETIIHAVRDMPNYHWNYQSFFLNLNILFGYQSGENVNAAIAIRPVIHQNMNGEDVKEILKAALKLPRGTRKNTLALTSQLTHKCMSGSDVAKIMAAVDQLENRKVISEISTSKVIREKMRGGDVVFLLEAAVKLPKETRRKTLALASQLIHDRLPGRDAAEIMTVINQLKSEVDPEDVVVHTAELLYNSMDGWYICHLLQTIEKFPPEEREQSRCFSIYSQSASLIEDFRKVPLKDRPRFSEAVRSFMIHESVDIRSIFKNLIDYPLEVIKLAACFAGRCKTASQIMNTLDLMKRLAGKINPEATTILGRFYFPGGRPLEQYLNALLQLPMHQQYEIVKCALANTKTLESFYEFLKTFSKLGESERIEIADLLNAYRQTENHPKLADIITIVSVFLENYVIYDYQLPFVFSAAKLFAYRSLAENCFPLFDLLDDTDSVPKIFYYLSRVSFAFTLDPLLKVLKGIKIRHSEELLHAVKFTTGDLKCYGSTVIEKAYPHLLQKTIELSSPNKQEMMGKAKFIPPEKYDDYFKLFNDPRCWVEEQFYWCNIFTVDPSLREDCHQYLMKKIQEKDEMTKIWAKDILLYSDDLHLQNRPLLTQCQFLVKETEQGSSS